MRRVFCLFISSIALLAAAASAVAQVEDKPFLEEERRRRMEDRARSEEEHRQPFLWDAGGWVHAEFVRLDDPPDRSHRTLRYYDLRLWAEVRFERRYRAFLRLQSDYADWNTGDQFEGEDDDQVHVARVDQAWLEGDFSSDESKFIIRVGREFLTLGRGLLLNGVHYGLMADYDSGRFGLRGLVAHSIPHDDDIDQSLPNSDDSRRLFAGVEASYLLTGAHRVYGLFLVERDLNEEDPEFAGVDWGYDATYAGLGARGEVVGGLGYALEAVYEFGKSVAAGSTEEESIGALALLVALDYTFGGEMAPYVTVEYMFGSGDPDRGSVTEGAGGNTVGTDDEGFLAFGFVQTGFSLFPRVSNIHIFRLGGSFRPLASLELFRTLELGGYGYLYRKDEASAPISDPRSFQDDDDVGEEIDLFLRWRILSDVGFSINFGRFMPGDAYADDDPRNFISLGLTYGF